jgi:hypothetical protein
MEANAEEAANIEAAGMEEIIIADEDESNVEEMDATITEEEMETTASNDDSIVSVTIEEDAELTTEYSNTLTEDIVDEATDNENNTEDKQEEEA